MKKRKKSSICGHLYKKKVKEKGKEKKKEKEEM